MGGAWNDMNSHGSYSVKSKHLAIAMHYEVVTLLLPAAHIPYQTVFQHIPVKKKSLGRIS